MYTVSSNSNFTVSHSLSHSEDGVEFLTLNAHCVSEPGKLELHISWLTPDIGVNAAWAPMGYINKIVRPDWGSLTASSAMSSAPIFANLAYDDTNRMTIACSDPKNSVKIRCGVVEETALLRSVVVINVDCAIDSYTAVLRIDKRPLPYYKVVEDIVKWWETFDGLAPARVPDTARQPLYSAWYSFHQHIDVPKIVEECRYFKALGCESIIVDDGWQTDDNSRGYAYCGDWEVAPGKIPDMKAFVDAVHETGMKFILWYSVPFVGLYSKAYERFKDKLLRADGSANTYVLDPRYPEVRDYLIGIYKNAALDWGLDGFKLDFIDSFRQSSDVHDGMDYVSVFDAVDRLMKDVLAALRAINPDILIEFRQHYMGPLMRTFGNMIRSMDCPNDSFSNRMNTLSLRMTSGNTAVHSDMVMWNYDESVEWAAFQLNNVLFSVPQISVLHDKMPADHAAMVKYFLTFWKAHRETLLDGEMLYKNYAANFPYVSSRKDNEQIGAVYGGMVAYLEEPTDTIILVNASMDKKILLDSKFEGRYTWTVCDCMGNEVSSGVTDIGYDDDCPGIAVPVSGYLTMKKV
ncbi:MAG: alpha-galactosidase [Ruminococcaceae bacterium]|nr:alpha-galactosidase [Oscillospiraceae bacterium]